MSDGKTGGSSVRKFVIVIVRRKNKNVDIKYTNKRQMDSKVVVGAYGSYPISSVR